MMMAGAKGAKHGVTIRLVKTAIWLLALVVMPVLTLSVVSPYSEGAWRASFYVVASLQRTISFPEFAWQRNARCSIWEAWAKAVPSQRILAARRLRVNSRLVRVEGNLHLIATPVGEFWIPARDLPALAEMLAEQEREVYGSDKGGVRPGDIVLDCGANVGVYTRHALNRGAKVVVAIEPAPESLECLRRNFRKEVSERRVIIYPKGVWNEDAELQLSVSNALASTASSVVLDRGHTGPTILLTTIDQIVEELKVARVDFIKMDIEGAERQALQGALRTVAEFRPRMAIAVEHRPSDPDEIPTLVKKLWPDYNLECGPCVNVNGSLQPDVLIAY